MNPNKDSNQEVTAGGPQTTRKIKLRLLLVLPAMAIGGAMLACSFFNGNRGTDPAGTAFAEASTALAVQEELSLLATQTMAASIPTDPPASQTPYPSQTPSPTNTAFPTQKSPASVSDVKFRPGGTSAYFQYAIQAGDQHSYHVRAQAGQTMIVSASSPNNDVYIEVKGLGDGLQLLWPGDQAASWFGTLPETQTYRVSLISPNPDTTYFLSIEIPANIYFASGAYSAKVDGYVDVDTRYHPDIITRVRYLAHASAGQTMTVKLTSSNLEDLSVGVFGQQDGQAYLRYQVKNSGGEWVLPATQGYYLDVYALNGKSTPFTLEITIK